MSKKIVSAVTVFLFTLIIGMVLVSATTRVYASSTPYYTFTTDNEYGWVRTSDAYTPNGQVLSADGSPFRVLEYVYVDHEDYVYVTDSGQSKVFIFDKDLNYIDKIEYFESEPGAADGFFAVNSIFVTEDKIYVPDSFRKSIFIFDRDKALNRNPQFNLWLEDIDASDSLTSGDVFYLSTEDTDEPYGTPVYEVEVTGQTESGKDIILFKDFTTKEPLFEKVDKEEMIGKILNWVTVDFEGKTLLKHTIYASKNEPIQVIKTPNAPAFIGDPDVIGDGYTFAPKKVVVDTRGNMYIVGAQSDAGLIMLGPEGDFITFFGGNPLRTPLIDQIRSVLLTEVQKEKLREQSDIYIDYISGVAIDEKGFVYTVTSTLEDNIIKKFNVSGKNYFNDNAPGWVGAVDLWVGQYGNVFTIEEFGWINEYNQNGELVFSFSVSDIGIDREGLLSLPKSIAADSNDNLYVADQGNKLLQVYKPTEFTNAVHSAFEAYQAGDEDQAASFWRYSLEYATIFDIAHVGLGNAYVRQDNYEDALREYTVASYNVGISDTYWQVRQVWMEKNLEVVFMVGIILILSNWIFGFFNKKYDLTKKPREGFKKLKEKSKLLDELVYIKEFLKHPLDGYYYIKRKNRVSGKTASVIYLLLGIVYVFYQTTTNIIFLPNSNPNVIYELLILTSILSLWIIANYFVCLIHDGEGSFKNVYTATAMSLTPLLIVVPVVTLLSNVLTYQEAVFYNIPLTLTFIWVAIYFFFMIKEIHNYEVGETFNVIFISMFTMLIMGIFIFVVYSLNSQIFTVSQEIVRELIER
jgi:tetratricopeptide (TPR) repeat protein